MRILQLQKKSVSRKYGKGKVVPGLSWISIAPWGRMGNRGIAPSFLTWVLDGGEWTASRPCRFSFCKHSRGSNRGNKVPDSNHQAAISRSASCKSLVFTVKPSQIHSLSTRLMSEASKRGRLEGTASITIQEEPGRLSVPNQASSFILQNKPKFSTQHYKAGKKGKSTQLLEEGRRWCRVHLCAGKLTKDKSGEQWIECPPRHDSYHENCVGVEALKGELFYDLCNMELRVSEVSVSVNSGLVSSVV
jgi:hypothetical protein